MANSNKVKELLNKIRNNIGRVVAFDFDKENVFIFDFTETNKELKNFDIFNTKKFTEYIFSKLKQNNTSVGIGKYNEDRKVYAKIPLFKGENESRTVHLGIDIWAEADTSVFAPLTGRVHSFKNNAKFGDYGPTIILEHQIEGIRFYTLYGHLNLDSIQNLKKGQIFNKGNSIAKIGNYPTNGSWPPHLHFQIITDMQGMEGDFPGVASLEDREKFLELCPDPNLILKIKKLGL